MSDVFGKKLGPSYIEGMVDAVDDISANLSRYIVLTELVFDISTNMNEACHMLSEAKLLFKSIQQCLLSISSNCRH